MLIVTDLDGTLRDSSHRDPLIRTAGWDAFYAAGADDPPIEAMCKLIACLYRQGHDVEIWTGTPERYRVETLEWLQVNTGLSLADFVTGDDMIGRASPGSVSRSAVPIRMLMRPDQDYRGANTTKGEWLEEYRKHWGRLPDLVFDDRTDCVAWWRSFRITCLDVAAHGY